MVCVWYAIHYNTNLLSLCREICLLARHLHKTFNTFNNNSVKHGAKTHIQSCVCVVYVIVCGVCVLHVIVRVCVCVCIVYVIVCVCVCVCGVCHSVCVCVCYVSVCVCVVYVSVCVWCML